MDTDYVYEILMQGNCGALVPGAWFLNGEKKVLVWDTDGLIGLYDADLRKIGNTGICNETGALLELTVNLFSALRTANDWLIPVHMLDLTPKGIWLDPEEKMVSFMLKDQSSAAHIQDDRIDSYPKAAARLAGDLSEYFGSAPASAAAARIAGSAQKGASLDDLIKLAVSQRLFAGLV